jgi:hypothetical protein
MQRVAECSAQQWLQPSCPANTAVAQSRVHRPRLFRGSAPSTLSPIRHAVCRPHERGSGDWRNRRSQVLLLHPWFFDLPPWVPRTFQLSMQVRPTVLHHCPCPTMLRHCPCPTVLCHCPCPTVLHHCSRTFTLCLAPVPLQSGCRVRCHAGACFHLAPCPFAACYSLPALACRFASLGSPRTGSASSSCPSCTDAS